MTNQEMSEVVIIGDDLPKEAAQINADIDYLLGYQTIEFEGKAIRSTKYGCEFAPNYCDDFELLQKHLKEINLHPIILPVRLKSHNKTIKALHLNPSSLFTASFLMNKEHYVTIPLETEEMALACALWYALFYLSLDK